MTTKITPRVLAVIGTAGRDKSITMTGDTWNLMTEDFRYALRPSDQPVSGGAAWSDHLAVYAYLHGWVGSLRLFLPAPLKNGAFDGSFQSSGGAANYYHLVFKDRTGYDSLKQIHQAIEKGAIAEYEPVAKGYGAMFKRNQKVAAIATACRAYTYGQGDEPADGGTKYTWDRIKSADKKHVCISKLK